MTSPVTARGASGETVRTASIPKLRRGANVGKRERFVTSIGSSRDRSFRVEDRRTAI
jgi:hypothetical protein